MLSHSDNIHARQGGLHIGRKRFSLEQFFHSVIVNIFRYGVGGASEPDGKEENEGGLFYSLV